MGKIRVKTFGDEELEKKESKKAQARAEAKKQAEAAKKAAEERTTAAEPKKASSDVIASEAKQSSEGEIAASPSAPRNDEVKKQKKEKYYLNGIEKLTTQIQLFISFLKNKQK